MGDVEPVAVAAGDRSGSPVASRDDAGRKGALHLLHLTTTRPRERRIVGFVSAGDTKQVGERFGLIRFGSRVDVYLPVGTRVMVGLGQKAVAGETVLADLGGGAGRAFRRI